MITFTSRRNLYGKWTNNETSANLTLGDQVMNFADKYLIQRFNLNERSKTTTTVASQQFYTLPYNYSKIIDVTILVGSLLWTPKAISSREQWDMLNMSQAVTNNYPAYYYVYNNQLGFYPKPTSDGNTITYNYKIRTKDLSQADYTTGTVAVTNGSTTVTGSGTTFVRDMIGRWLQVTAPNGDNQWYKISAFSSTTSLTLESAYDGTTVSGASYTIGETGIIPEDYQDLSLIYAVRQYYASRVKDAEIFAMYKSMYDERFAMMKDQLDSKTDDYVINTGRNPNFINPNLLLTL